MKPILPALALALAACSGGSSSFQSRIGSPTGAVRTRGSPDALTLTNGIVLSRVRIVIQRIQLKMEESGDSGGDSEIKVGPYLTDFSGATLDNGTPQLLFDAEVPQAVYKKIKFKIHKVEDNEATTPELQEMKSKSVVVEGTIDGNAFTFVSSLDEEDERKGSFDIGGDDSLVFSFNPTGWFTKNGARLDPRDSANKSDIEKNIKASLECYDDDDKDGKK